MAGTVPYFHRLPKQLAQCWKTVNVKKHQLFPIVTIQNPVVVDAQEQNLFPGVEGGEEHSRHFIRILAGERTQLLLLSAFSEWMWHLFSNQDTQCEISAWAVRCETKAIKVRTFVLCFLPNQPLHHQPDPSPFSPQRLEPVLHLYFVCLSSVLP